jgi:hypothetical protein
MDGWIEYPPLVPPLPVVTIWWRGEIWLNDAAMHVLGYPDSVQLLLNRTLSVPCIGLKASSKNDPHGVDVFYNHSHWLITCPAFLNALWYRGVHKGEFNGIISEHQFRPILVIRLKADDA